MNMPDFITNADAEKEKENVKKDAKRTAVGGKLNKIHSGTTTASNTEQKIVVRVLKEEEKPADIPPKGITELKYSQCTSWLQNKTNRVAIH